MTMTDRQIFAFVIVMGGSKEADPLYFCGMDSFGRFKWTRDVMNAVRFARRKDAEKVTPGDELHTKHRIIEHGWIESAAAGEGGQAGTRNGVSTAGPGESSTRT